MPLLNYTTTVAPGSTIAAMQQMLAKGGARQILTEYFDDGRPSGLGFAVETGYGLRKFTLPVNAERVLAVLKRDRQVPNRFKTKDQAERVAWRILKDWLEAQLAIIATEMVTLDQVMLPYMATPSGVSVYELFRDQQLALPSPDAAARGGVSDA